MENEKCCHKHCDDCPYQDQACLDPNVPIELQLYCEDETLFFDPEEFRESNAFTN